MIGRVFAVEGHLYVEVRRRDASGYDYCSDVLGPFSTPSELGEQLLESLKGSDARGSGAAHSDRWKMVLRKLGFRSERAFTSGSDIVMCTGKYGSELRLQPFVREHGEHVGASMAFMRTVSWSAPEVGATLIEMFASIRNGSVSVDPSQSSHEVVNNGDSELELRVGDIVWHIVRRARCRVVSVDPDDQHGLGAVTLLFDDGSTLSAPLLAPGVERHRPS